MLLCYFFKLLFCKIVLLQCLQFYAEINLQKTTRTITRWCDIFAIVFFVILLGEKLVMHGFAFVRGNMKKT